MMKLAAPWNGSSPYVGKLRTANHAIYKARWSSQNSQMG
jgi:hypothetical protein